MVPSLHTPHIPIFLLSWSLCVCDPLLVFFHYHFLMFTKHCPPLNTPMSLLFLYHFSLFNPPRLLFTPPNYWTPYNHVVKSLFLGFKRVWHTWKKCVIKMFYLILRKHALFYNKFLKCFEICWFHGGRNLYLHKWND